MKEKAETYDVGVIVGRFQVPELHREHKNLIQFVCDRHDKVIIFLGLSPLLVTKDNPLDFESRKQMILDQFPNVNVLYIKDQFSDDVWSRRLDDQISDLLTPSQSVALYGARDSFISHYMGRYPTIELESDVYTSGTEVRREVSKKSVKGTPDFRAGVVWAAFNKFPTAYTTVDVAIFDRAKDRILLGKKANEPAYRLIGGFSDPCTDSFEQDVRKEVMEEAHIEIGEPKYICSRKIDDWRYRNEEDCIKTLLFTATYVYGAPKAGDDIAEVRWFDIDKVKPNDIMPNHTWLVSEAIRDYKNLR